VVSTDTQRNMVVPSTTRHKGARSWRRLIPPSNPKKSKNCRDLDYSYLNSE